MALTKIALTCWTSDVPEMALFAYLDPNELSCITGTTRGEGVGAWSCGVTPDYETILSQPSSP
jgi:hypothetical protein